jgi:hypothetical protein
LVRKLVVVLGSIMAASTWPWRTPICIPTGSPAFRSLIPPLLHALYLFVLFAALLAAKGV